MVEEEAVQLNLNGLVLEWTNISYSVETRGSGPLQILKNLSGRVTPGRVLGILGPSGSGKTSLLNALSGRLTIGVEGDVSINGCSVNPVEFRSAVAYVTQDDVHTPLQTVREALHFSAALRLWEDEKEASKAYLKEKRDVLVHNLLEELMLTKCADTYLGGGRIRGVSGGERKRVSIAQELITSPKIIFLDEPISGLDAYSAYTTVTLLKKLSKAKCMMTICTVHQPSSEIFSEFDDCLLLNEGNCVYNGSVEAITSYFADLGKPCPNFYNPADFILFMVQTSTSKELNKLYEVWIPRNKKMRAIIEKSRKEHTLDGITFKKKRMKGFCTQFHQVIIRDWRNFYRNRSHLCVMFAINLFMNMVVGAVFWKVAVGNEIDAHFGAIVQVAISTMFQSGNSVLLTFALERAVFVRDYQNGSYDSPAWVLSKTLVELPSMLFFNFFAVLLFFLFMRLQGDYFLLSLLFTGVGFCATSMAMVLGTIGKDPKTALELSPLIFVPQILFAGIFIPITQIPEVLRWAQWLCFLKYGINLISIVELQGEGEKEQIYDKLDIKESEWIFYLLVLVLIPVVTRILAVFFAERAAQSTYDNS